ncbi:MAG: rhs family protein [Bacteroidetes bacterium]|nr:rhs family protein [Bacteroidota bacterium]
MQRQLTIILFVCCVVLVRAASIPIAILSPDFGASYRPYWSLNGASTIVNDKLQLTDDVTNQSGTAFWTGTVCNSNGFKFSAFFSFTITHSGSGSYADGLAFIIQQYANSWGASGGGLGYEGLPGKSIAIEYDTYKNSEYGDPDINHIAIDFGGSVKHPDNTYYAKSSVLTGAGVNLTAGKTFYSWIDYDGSKLQVRISTTTTRPATPVLSYTYDLASYFDGANVYYGFGGATGASMEKNIINSAYINNDYTPIDFLSNTYTQKTPSVSTTNASICRGDSYTFNGTTYTTAGTYAAQLTNAVGCDSTATLQLTVREPSSSTTNASICRGESYSFNGTTYTAAGTYQAHGTFDKRSWLRQYRNVALNGQRTEQFYYQCFNLPWRKLCF